jgi:iron complex transport system substrate-binding protein
MVFPAMTRHFMFACALLAALLAAGCDERARATATDDIGRPVAVPGRASRIVSLSPNLTEMLFAVGAGDRIVGTDDFSNFPRAARAIPKVGGMQPNIEKIASLRPDLVFASTEGNHPNLAPALAAAGIPLYVVRTDRLAEIAPAMRRIGKLIDARQADDAVTNLERGIARERRMRDDAPRIMFAVWTDPLYVGGPETFTSDLIELTGAHNAVTVPGWPQYSLESVLAAPPDILLYPRSSVTSAQIAALRVRLPGVDVRVVPVDDDIFQRPGPRVVDAARRLNAILDAAEDEPRIR